MKKKMTFQQVIDSLNWSDWKDLENGERYRTAKPTDLFAKAYNENQNVMRKKGITARKRNLTWEVVQYSEPFEIVEKIQRPESVNLNVEEKLLVYQRPHVKNLVSVLNLRQAAIDSSDTGTGKTYSSLGVACEMGYTPIVICPKAVIPSWYKAAKHFGIKMLDVINYESIRTGNSEWLLREDEEIEIDDGKIKKELKNLSWQLPEKAIIIWDEVHRCKNFNTINAQMLVEGKKQNIKMLLLSATAGDSPANFKAIGYALGLFKPEEYYGWATNYGCGKTEFGDFGFNGTEEDLIRLNKVLYPQFGSRISIKDLGDQFPETQIIAESYDMGSNSSAIQKSYDKMKAELQRLKELREKDKNPHMVLTAILRNRQEVEILKVPTIVDMAKDYKEEGHSIAIFVNFDETLQAIAQQLGTDCVVKGGQSLRERQKCIDAFQNDEQRFIICNIRAGGVGISLHDLNGKYSRVALISPSFSAQDILQALGRVHRAGGLSKSIQRLVYAKNTIEETITERVSEKINRIHLINDGTIEKGKVVDIPLTNRDLFAA